MNTNLDCEIVYFTPSTQLCAFATFNSSLKLKFATYFDPLCGHHQANTGTYMCILNCKRLPNIWRIRGRDWLPAGRPRSQSSSPGSVKNFLFSTSSRPALEATQPPIQRLQGAFSRGVKRQWREAHLQRVPRSRKSGSIHPLPHTPSWNSA
jgi:hypothetical protein